MLSLHKKNFTMYCMLLTQPSKINTNIPQTHREENIPFSFCYIPTQQTNYIFIASDVFIEVVKKNLVFHLQVS
jgi:hypothetical protein